MSETRARRVLMLSTYDQQGGAAISAYRIHQGQRQIGLESTMLVQHRSSDDPHVIRAGSRLSLPGRLRLAAAPWLEARPLRRYPQRSREAFHTGSRLAPTLRLVNAFDAHIVFLYWTWGGFLPPQDVARIRAPVVWRIPEASPFTGGCHVAYDCERFKDRCGRCPLLASDREDDLSRRMWQRKARAWRDLDIAVVAASRWMADQARASSLLGGQDVRVISNGMDLTRFRPLPRAAARELLNLPPDRLLLAYGAVKPFSASIKGYHLLAPALERLAADWADKLELVVFGASGPAEGEHPVLPTHYLGRIHDERLLAAVYSAADVVVMPSIQEAFGQVAAEALACGTPAVAFGATGLLDVVTHQHDGYLAQPYDPADLAAGIAWVLADDERHTRLGVNARATAEARFDQREIARQYAALYEERIAHHQQKAASSS